MPRERVTLHAAAIDRAGAFADTDDADEVRITVVTVEGELTAERVYLPREHPEAWVWGFAAVLNRQRMPDGCSLVSQADAVEGLRGKHSRRATQARIALAREGARVDAADAWLSRNRRTEARDV